MIDSYNLIHPSEDSSRIGFYSKYIKSVKPENIFIDSLIIDYKKSSIEVIKPSISKDTFYLNLHTTKDRYYEVYGRVIYFFNMDEVKMEVKFRHAFTPSEIDLLPAIY